MAIENDDRTIDSPEPESSSPEGKSYKHAVSYIGGDVYSLSRFDPADFGERIIYVEPQDPLPLTPSPSPVIVVPREKEWWKRWWIWLLIVLCIIALVCSLLQLADSDGDGYSNAPITAGDSDNTTSGYGGNDTDSPSDSPDSVESESSTDGSTAGSSGDSSTSVIISGTDSWNSPPEGVDVEGIVVGIEEENPDPAVTWEGTSSNTSDIIDKTTMTDYAVMLFMHAQPRVVDEDVFDESFTTGQDNSSGVILGLYIPSITESAELKDGGTVELSLETAPDYIYIKRFDDPSLTNQLYVTAAHEMLHAAWTHYPYNLDNRDDFEELLRDEYSKDKELQERMKLYLDSGISENSDAFADELHSIIGTEKADISSELEDYYSVYFNDRSKIVEYSMR